MKRNYHFVLLLCILLFSSALIQAQSDAESYVQLFEKAKKNENVADAAAYSNKAAFIFWNNQEFEKAIKYFHEALTYSKKMNNLNGIRIIEYNLGMIYSDLENYDEAIPHLRNGLEISRNLQDKESIASGHTNIAASLQGIGKHEEAIVHLEKAIALSKELNNMKLLRRCYGLMFESYEQTGQSEKAFEYFELYSSFDREIKKTEMEEVKTEAKHQVDVAKAEKEKTAKELNIRTNQLKVTEDSLAVAEKLTKEQRMELELKQAQLREKDAKLRTRRWISIFFASLAIFISLLALLLFIQFRNKKRANIMLAKLNKKLEIQHKNITSSIEYGKNIQSAILPENIVYPGVFESFVFFKPKDIVSGDFFWTSELDGKYFVAAVDCTGHGVPGAFMSLIGNRLLNEIVNERKETTPSKVMTKLDEEVQIALRQKETANSDGMDVCLCLIEPTGDNGAAKITYCGAKRPLYYYSAAESKLNRYRGDRRSVGGQRGNKSNVSFTDTQLDVSKEDMIYLTSDGLVDQGGKDRKRFGSRKFESLIESMANKNLNDQHTILDTAITNYMDDAEQRDDMTVIGVKFL